MIAKKILCFSLFLLGVQSFHVNSVARKHVGATIHQKLQPSPYVSENLNSGATSLNLFRRSREQKQSFGSNGDVSVRQSRRSKFLKKWARRLSYVAFFLTLHFASLGSAAARGSGGRMGGSFRPSGRSYSSRPMPRSSGRIYAPPSRSRPIRVYSAPSPRIVIHQSPSIGPLGVQTVRRPVRRGISATDLALVAGVGSVVTYKVKNYYKNGPGSPVAPGISVLSLTVALNVPDRDDPNSILSILNRKARMSRTDTRRGVQDLVSDVALTLLRQEGAIVSVESKFKNFRNSEEAEREFNSLSFAQRSKLDRESASNYGGKQDVVRESSNIDNTKATNAVVSISVCIDGDTRRMPVIRNRSQLRDTLSWVASESQIGDCLLAGEVIWTPEERSDYLSLEDVYADYPSLIPLID